MKAKKLIALFVSLIAVFCLCLTACNNNSANPGTTQPASSENSTAIIPSMPEGDITIPSSDEETSEEESEEKTEEITEEDSETEESSEEETEVTEETSAVEETTSEETTEETTTTAETTTAETTTAETTTQETTKETVAPEEAPTLSPDSKSDSKLNHSHKWVEVTKTIQHPAEYETVHHEAEYDADGKLIKSEYDEKVLVKSAWSERVAVGQKCSICGEYEEYDN